MHVHLQFKVLLKLIPYNILRAEKMDVTTLVSSSIYSTFALFLIYKTISCKIVNDISVMCSKNLTNLKILEDRSCNMKNYTTKYKENQ